MRLLAVSNLFPSSLEPNRATFNRQHFEHLGQSTDLRLLVPLAWPTRLRGGAPERADQMRGTVDFATFVYPPKLLPGQHGRFCRWSLRSSFDRACRSHQPELVYATWVYPDAYACAGLAARHGLQLVVKVHGSDLHSVRGVRQRRAFETLRQARRVITVSEHLRQLAVDAGVAPEKVVTIYNGVDRELFAAADQADSRRRLGLDLQRPLVVFVGNLKPIKGIDRLLRGFAAARTTAADLCLIGQGAERAGLEALAAELEITERVQFCGAVDHDLIPSWISAADTLALLSHNEGVPNVLLEAKACGTPVVAAAVGGIPEVVNDGVDGLVLEDCSPVAIGAAIDAALDRSAWDRDAIRAASARFDWQRNAADTLAVLREALDG